MSYDAIEFDIEQWYVTDEFQPFKFIGENFIITLCG